MGTGQSAPMPSEMLPTLVQSGTMSKTGDPLEKSLLRDAFCEVDTSSTHCLHGVEDTEKALDTLKLTKPSKVDLESIIKEVAVDPANINFSEFRRVVCISQDMLQDTDGVVQTLADVGGNREHFIEVLDDHREECEREGDYEEAKATYMRLCELRRDDDSRSRDELLNRQQMEAESVEMAHDREQAYFFGVWDKRMAEFEETAEEALGKLREKHELELCTFQEQFAARESQRTPKLSRDLLNLRRIQEALVKQKDYNEAMKVKRDADKVEAKELMSLQAKGQETLRIKVAEIQRRQGQEYEALAKRIQRSRDEALRQRDHEYKRMLQRYNNVKISLSAHHRQEARAVIAAAERRQAIQQAKNPLPA